MAAIRVYVKRQIRLDRLNFGQQQMFKLGTVAVATLKNRVTAAQNASDQPAKPLKKRYAIAKSKLRRFGGLGTNKRDLTLSGNMLRELSVRTVSENRVVAGWTTLKNRQKARNNDAIEKFIDLSPRNQNDVHRAADLVVKESVRHLIIEKAFNR
mgnify:CR=1 FL=1